MGREGEAVCLVGVDSLREVSSGVNRAICLFGTRTVSWCPLLAPTCVPAGIGLDNTSPRGDPCRTKSWAADSCC
jgi:hypothetical protein